MAKNIVLDALIPREDFEVEDAISGTTRNIATIGVRDLEYESFFFAALRKPDFQRETNEWDSKRIVSLVESFISGDLIPAIILWRNPNSNTFVIDGAHRISALAAWVNDDYGDGKISKAFFEGKIPEEQLESAERTRLAVRKKIGTFKDHQMALKNPEKVEGFIVERAKSMGALAIQVQWVEGDTKKAETSFFKINQQAASIDKTELILLKSRHKPNGIATRAILRSGRGHKYWSSYSEAVQAEIQNISEQINDIIFLPALKNPIKTLDLPLGGKSFSSQSQSLILELVNKTNKISKTEELPDDDDGAETLQFLRQCLKVARRLNSIHPSSLGLHPAVYFYTRDGRHKPASFWAAIDFVMYLEEKNKYKWFTEKREGFEDFLLGNDYIIQQVVRRYRSASAAYPYIKDLYIDVLTYLHSGNLVEDLGKLLKANADYSYITLDGAEEYESLSLDFSREKKSEIFIKEAVGATVRCSICGGLLHRNAITIDHIERRQDGGLGNVDNGQLAHPFCNSTYKN